MSKKRITNNQGEIIRPGSWIGEEEYDLIAGGILAGANVGDDSSGVEDEIWDNPQYNDDSIKVYQAYEEIFGTPRSVFYPACGIDGSPAMGFPNSEILFLDPCREYVDIMRKEGFSVLEKGIEDYDGKHDLIILLNPHFDSVLALNNLEDGGRIIANNYFGADAAGPLMKHGVPLLKKFGMDDGRVVELPLEDKVTHEYRFVFGREVE